MAVDRLQRDRVEAIRVEQRRLIVIAQYGDLREFDHFVKTLARIRSIADDVSEAVNLGDLLFANVRQYRSQRLEIGVYIANQCSLHANLTSNNVI